MAEQAGVDVAALSGSTSSRITAEDVRQQVAAQGGAHGRVFSSPHARSGRASWASRGVDLHGSGPRNRVIERDILSAVAGLRPSQDVPSTGHGRLDDGRARPALAGVLPESEAVRWETPTPIQRITGERMAASFSTAPHFYLTAEVIASQLLHARERLLPIVERPRGRPPYGHRPAAADLRGRAQPSPAGQRLLAGRAYRDQRGGEHRAGSRGHSDSSGLVVPVLRDADRKPLSQIAEERTDLVERARAGTLRPDDLAGGTFTLTNLGMYRVDTFQAILNPPQSAILAVGRIVDRAVVLNGQLAARPTALLTLTCDHRVLDGAIAAAFLGELAELCEEPMALLA